jgi:tetratricopeptide (TPR) repeat protein
VHSYDVLAWALHGTGQYEEAADASERALALGTEEVGMLYHAGMIQAALGHEAAARDFLQRALDLNPRFDVVDAEVAERTLDDLGGGDG